MGVLLLRQPSMLLSLVDEPGFCTPVSTAP